MQARTAMGISIIVAAALLILFIVSPIGVLVNNVFIGSQDNIDFVDGTNVTITAIQDPTNDVVRVTINSATSSAYNLIQDEGVNRTQQTTVNFTGAGVDCTNGATTTDCDIPSGGGVTRFDALDDVNISATSSADIVLSDGQWTNVQISGDATLVTTGILTVGTSTGFRLNPTDCAGGEFASAIDREGDLTCSVPAGGGGSVSTTTIQVEDVTVFATSSPTLDFGIIFDVTESPNGEANIVLDFTELKSTTFGDNIGGFTWSFDVGGAQDTSIQFGNNLILFEDSITVKGASLVFGNNTVSTLSLIFDVDESPDPFLRYDSISDNRFESNKPWDFGPNLISGSGGITQSGGAVDFGAATSLEIPQCGTTDADGEICSRTNATSTLFVWFQGEQHALSATSSKGLLIFQATSTDDFALWRTDDHIVLTKACFLAEGGTNVILSLQEFDSNGNSPSTLMSGDLTAAAGSTGCTGESGEPTMNENTIEGGNWIGTVITSVSGTNTRLHITWYFKWIL